ncbi:UrvD/REP family ATP-dependent DNA helicase [Rothia sp. HMSC066G02]|uniref:UrvD/REP family ATP-dependent DNA helicase n=1 Tax=Rothia sp. HMSC066G02 TaxID=1739398 RepID=UPI0008A4177D|nr:UrvD/REP family ATP-dependent DNA helicase [Rothia sp. HMSC066G02]OFR25835.1 ATP-dependent DNA helicase [Rothia sp. HMSC066G02]
MTTQLLTGIPGTGKTHHLTERALRYLADGNDPARLLILAPTRTAATRMRDTIAASSDRSLSVAPTRAWAAYAFDLLKRAQTRGLLSGVEGNLKLLSGPEQDVIIGELLANHAEGIAPGPAWPDVLRDALATRGFRHEIRDFFDRMAEYDLTAEDVHALATEHNQPAWHALAQLHTEYRAVRALRAKNAYDPAVLINDACRLLLRAPEFLAEERRRYDLILIDDVQELSPSIYRLLRLIAAEVAPADAAHLTETHPDLFAEGPQVVMTYSDEAVVQGFRGARPDLVTTLQASFPSMRTRTLTTSYRLPALMMPLVADIRRRLPRYTRFVPLTAEQERAKNGAQEGSKNGVLEGVKNGAPATFGRINTTPADEALTWGAADEPLLHLGADGKILDPAHYRTAPAGVYKYALSSSQDEANLIAQMLLEERIYGNHPYRESAIIVRNGADVARIRRVLSSNGIPSRTSAALVPVRDEPAVRPFLDALSLLVYARKRGEKALNPAVHMPAGEGTEVGEHGGYETLSATEAEELMRRSLNDVIAEESRANPLGGAQSAITLLTSRLGGASSMDVRRLRQQLRSIELQSGGHRPSDDLLLGALLHPETLPEEGVGRAVHRIAAVLSAGRKALARPESTSTEVLWALWEASGLEKVWVAQTRNAGPDADAAHRNLDAMVGLFEAADRFDEQMRGAGAEQFLDFIDAQDLPMDTLAARGVRQDAVEILTPALAAGQSWRTVYVCGLQEGTWPNTTVRGSLLATGDLVDLCDARIRQRAQQQAGEQPVPPARIRSYPERVRDTRHDELRMFAVAATRASTRLVLTAVRNDDQAPGEFFDFVLPTDAVGESTDVPITRVRRPATLRSLVAELRRTLVEESMNAMRAEDAQQEDTQQNGAQMHNAPEEDTLTPEASAYRLDAASRTLARLANAQAPGAAPDEWWGLLPLSSTELLFAHRPADHAELDENRGEDGEEQAENPPENPPENPGRRTITLSPSRLETIHSSPLDWLVSAARAEAQTDLSRSLGTLVHAIAEEYPTGTLEELQTALDERISSLGVPARKEDETDEKYRERVPWESYALYERAKRMILRLSYYYRQHMGDAGWQNLGVEGSFAVRVPVPFDPAGEVGELDALLTGRVDRLEGTAPAEDGTRRYAIVDLKTGKSKPTGSEMETHPQLAAYQIAVEAGAGEQLEERYRAEAAALEAGEPLPDARPQELEYTGYTGHSAGAALVQLGASGVNDESKTRLQVQPALTEHDSWAAELVQHAAELIAGSQVQARHREGGYGCRLPEICPICTRGRQVTQP